MSVPPLPCMYFSAETTSGRSESVSPYQSEPSLFLPSWMGITATWNGTFSEAR